MIDAVPPQPAMAAADLSLRIIDESMALLERSPAGLAFRDELIREAIHQDLVPALRQGLHREVARVLIAAGEPGGRPPVPGSLRRGDPTGAHDQARRARALGPDDDFTGCLACQTLALTAQERGNVLWVPRHHAARALLEDAWALAAPLRFCLSYRFLAPDLVGLVVAAGDRDRATAVAQEVTDGAARCGVGQFDSQ